jgi:hypothetical protein
MTTRVQTFPAMDGLATLTLPRSETRWRIAAIHLFIVADPLGPVAVTPLITINHAGVCTTFLLAGEQIVAGLSAWHTWGRQLDDHVDTRTPSTSVVVRRSLPDYILSPNDTVTISTAEGDASTTVSDIVVITEDAAR